MPVLAPDLPARSYRRLDHGARVLVVEDVPVTLEFLCAVLEESSYQVRRAATAAEALAALAEELPDLLVLDLHLPDLHGLEICRQLRHRLGGEDIPVLVVTVEDSPSGHAEAVRAGADDFLRKPIVAVELQTRARSLIRLRYLRRELRADREAILQMQAQKDGLVQFVVHDLKNLLAAVQASLDLMVAETGGGPNERHQARLGTSLRTMRAMVTDLLDLSMADRAELVADVGTFELGPWLAQVVQEFEPLAARGNRRIVLDPVGPGTVEADPHLLRRVVSNLLENAIRFAPAETAIRVAGRVEGGVRIEVGNEGEPVPDHLKQEIFERFARGPQRTHGGRGLGLAFCRLVLDMHRGRIWVEDQQPRGSRFILEMPESGETLPG